MAYQNMTMPSTERRSAGEAHSDGHSTSSGLGAGCTLKASTSPVCGYTVECAARLAAWGVLKSTMKLPVSGPASTCGREGMHQCVKRRGLSLRGKKQAGVVKGGHEGSKQQCAHFGFVLIKYKTSANTRQRQLIYHRTFFCSTLIFASSSSSSPRCSASTSFAGFFGCCCWSCCCL